MAKKSLIPCDFITTKGGKEVRLSYDQMRQFLFDNPEMWTPSSSRRIGAGKAQASLGGRGALSSVEATTQALKDTFDDGEKFLVLKHITGALRQNLNDLEYLVESENDLSIAKKIKPLQASITNEMELIEKTSKKNEVNFNQQLTKFKAKFDEIKELIDSLEESSPDINQIKNAFSEVSEAGVDEWINVNSKYKAKKYHEAKAKGETTPIVKEIEEAFGKGKMQASEGGRGNAEIDKIISDTKANGTYLKAPNGKPTNLNEFQWAQVRTKNFKNWFGDWESDPENASKILDDNGEPQVLFTGTSKDKDFDKFNVPQNGVWFTTDPEEASKYAFENDSMDYKFNYETGEYEDKNKAPRVIPVFLNIRRPEFFNEAVTPEQREKVRYAVDYKKLQKRYFQDIYFRKSIGERTDGLYYTDDKKVVVVLEDPTQIKSAIGNTGAFSPVNAKMQASEGGRGGLGGNEGQDQIKFEDRTKALGAAGKAYTAAGQSGYKQDKKEEAGINAATKYLKEKGYTNEQIEDGFIPKLKLQYQRAARESVEGAIAIAYIPSEVMERIGAMDSMSIEEIREMGLQAIKNKTVDPKAISEAFANGMARPLNSIEVSAMIAYKVSLNERYSKALKKLEELNSSAIKDSVEVNSAENEVLSVENDLENYYIASRKSGSEMGRAFRVRQMLLDKDYELVDIKLRYRAKYGSIPPDVMARLVNIDAELKAINEAQEKLNKEREEFEQYKAMANLVQDVAEEKKGKRTSGSSMGEYIEKNLLNKLNKFANIFSKKKGSGQASLGSRSQEELSDGEIVWVDAVTLAAGVFGKTNKPTPDDRQKAIKAGSDYITKSSWYKDLSKADQAEALQAFSSFIDKESTPPSVTVKDGKIKIPHETLRQYVQRAIEEFDIREDDPAKYRKLMTLVAKTIHDDMATELDPEIRWEDIRDAITRYGIQTYPSKEETEVDIRKMKAIGQKMAQLEDLLTGNRPLKTGYQRDPTSPEARELQKQVNNLLKDLELTPFERAEFLKTSLDRIKTTLRNRIEDLKRQKKELEETGKRTVREKRATIYDDEANFLKEEIEKLEAEVNALDKEGNMKRAEKQLESAINTLINSIEEYKRRIVEKDFSNFKQATNKFENLPKTAQYKTLQAERDALRKQLADMKKGPAKSPLDKKLDELQKEYDSLLDGTYKPKAAPVQYNDPRLKTLRDNISALKKQLGFTKTKEDVRLERLRKELSDLMQGKVKAGANPLADTYASKLLKQQIQNQKDLMGITQAQKIRSAEKQKEAQLRKVEERIRTLQTTGQDVVGSQTITTAYTDLLNQQIKDKQKIVKDLLESLGIAEQKRLEAEKNRARAYITKKEEKIANKDFGPRPIKDKNWDQEMLDIQAKKMAVQEKYEEEFIRAKLAERPWYKKGWDTFGDIVDLSKPLASGLDLSAVLRQGLFEVLSQSPVTTAKAFGFMIETALGLSDAKAEEKYEKWLNSVKASPMYYEMKQANLYLAEPSARMRATEESFANKLVQYLPLIEMPVGYGKYKYSLHIYKRSERAFNSFLNYMRVAAFTEATEALKDAGVTLANDKETYKTIAEIINMSTGRPSLGNAEGFATLFNKFIFSIRLQYSRFMFLTLPFRIPFMPPAARRYAIIKSARVFGSLATIMGLAFLYLENDDDDETYVEVDPRGKFLNINIDENTSINLTSGMSQFVSLLTKLVYGEYKKPATGEIRKLSGRGGTMMDPGTGDVMVDFATGKASPSARFSMEYMTAREDELDPNIKYNVYGERYDVVESLQSLGTALMVQDAGKIIEQGHILRGSGLFTLAILGGSVTIKGKKEKTLRQQVNEAIYGDKKDRELQLEKFGIQMRQDNIVKAKKILQAETDTILNRAKSKQQIDPDSIVNGRPFSMNVKGDLAYAAFKKDAGDGLLSKTGLEKVVVRNYFFALMAETELPEMAPGTPIEVLQEDYESRAKAMEIFSKTPVAARKGIIKKYYQATLDRDQLAERYNQLDIKDFDWKKVTLGNNDFYPIFKYYEGSKNFQKIINEYKQSEK